MAKKDKEQREQKKFEQERAHWKKDSVRQRQKKSSSFDGTAFVIRLIAGVVSGAVVLSLVVSYGSNYGIPGRWTRALTVGNARVSQQEWAFVFSSYYQSVLQNAQQYLQYGLTQEQLTSMIHLNPTQSPFGQESPYASDLTVIEEGDDREHITWDQFLREQNNQELQKMLAIYAEAKKAGTALNPEDEKKLEDDIEQLRLQAQQSHMSISAFLRLSAGPGITETLYRKILQRELLVNAYLLQKQEDLRAGYTDPDLQSVYEKHPENYDYADIRVYSFAREVLLAETEESDSALKKRQNTSDKALENKVKSFLSEIKSEQDFINKAAKEQDSEGYDADTETAFPRANQASLKQRYGSDGEAFKDFLFAKKNKTGTVGLVKGETSTYAVYVTRAAYAPQTVDFYSIAIAEEAEETEPVLGEDGLPVEAAEPDPESLRARAKEKAEKLLERWNQEGANRETFVKLVEELNPNPDLPAVPKETETKSKNKNKNKNKKQEPEAEIEPVVPGDFALTKHTRPGDIGDDVLDAWLYSSKRKSGDTAVLETSSGVKVVFLAEKHEDEPVWKLDIQDETVNEDMDAWLEELRERYPVKERKLGMWFALRSAETMSLRKIEQMLQQSQGGYGQDLQYDY